jgi:exonuclease SbcC
MWEIKKLELTNFLSHKKTFFEFEKGLNMIFGTIANNTDKSNGSGKSTILEGIIFAIFGTPFRDVKNEELVMDGRAEGAVITLYLLNSTLKTELKIVRTIKKGATTVKIDKDGEHLTQLFSVAECNNYLIDQIGLTKEELVQFFIIRKNNVNNFFSISDQKRKDIILQLSNLTNLKDLSKTLTEQLKTIEAELRLQNSLLQEKQKDVVYFTQAIKDNQNIDTAKIQVELIAKIDTLQKNNQNIDKKLKQIDTAKLDYQLLTVKKQLQGQKERDNLEVTKFTKKLKEEKRSLTELQNIETILTSNLNGGVSCPKCNYEFVAGQEMTIQEMKDNLAEIKPLINSCRTAIKELNIKIETLQKKEYSQYIEIEELEAEGRKLNSEKQILEQNERDNIRLIELNTKNLEQYKNLNPEAINKANVQKLESVNMEILNYNIQIADLNKKKEDILFWANHFGIKGFLSFCVNNTIKNIESRINLLLNKFFANLQIEIAGFKKLKNGDVREQIEISLIKEDYTKGSFSRFSEGEKMRIVLCVLIVFIQLINQKTTHGKGLNMFCLDEIFESLDYNGQLMAIELLKNCGLNVFLISHTIDIFQIDQVNKITVIKQNNITRNV